MQLLNLFQSKLARGRPCLTQHASRQDRTLPRLFSLQQASHRELLVTRTNLGQRSLFLFLQFLLIKVAFDSF